MRLMIVTGMPGSGKEEFLNSALELNIPFIRMGDVVREFHSMSGEEMGIGDFAGLERERHGFNIWAKRSMEKMHGSAFLVDGCRSMAEVEAFRSLSDDVYIVAIHTPPKIRFQRLMERGRDDAPSDYAEFEKRDRREIGWGIAEVIVLSDVMVINDGSLEQFRRSSKKVLEGVG